jgi:hypothetical protein
LINVMSSMVDDMANLLLNCGSQSFYIIFVNFDLNLFMKS